MWLPGLQDLEQELLADLSHRQLLLLLRHIGSLDSALRLHGVLEPFLSSLRPLRVLGI